MKKEFYYSDFVNDRNKRARRNPLGEDIYLRPDGTIEKDVEKIIFFQRWWLDRLYKFEDGIFYKKIFLKYKDGFPDS